MHRPIARRGRLDAALDLAAGRALPGESPDQVRRIRVAAVLSLLILSQAALFLFWDLAIYGFHVTVAIDVFALAAFGLTWLASRRWRRPQISGAVICFGINAICVVCALYEDAKGTLSVPFSIGLPILAMYLAGRRTGLAMTLLLMVELVVVDRVRAAGFSLGRLSPTDTAGGHLMVVAADVLGVLGLSAVGLLHSQERGHALATLEASEANLLSVLESTTDLVASADRDLALVVANSAFLRGLELRHEVRPVPGQPLPMDALGEAEWKSHLPAALAGERVRFVEQHEWQGRRMWWEINFNPVRSHAGEVVGITAFCRDITEGKEAEASLEAMHRELVTASRRAGMAEVATGVLHNVGNALNSVNVSAQLVAERLRASAVHSLRRGTALAEEHLEDPAFFASDPKGRKLPAYFVEAGRALEAERVANAKELAAILDGLEHIKAVVSMQQSLARSGGVQQNADPSELMEDALRLDAGLLEKFGVKVRRDYQKLPELLVDRHKVLQILVNLLSNARHALAGVEAPQLVLQVGASAGGGVAFEVQDNGTGIAPEDMERIFRQGFTTRKDGHGFGLHSAANTAREMGGKLTCSSEGKGHGARFRLELPRQEHSRETQEGACRAA